MKEEMETSVVLRRLEALPVVHQFGQQLGIATRRDLPFFNDVTLSTLYINLDVMAMWIASPR